MRFKRGLLLGLFILSLGLFFPKPLGAINIQESLTSENSIIVKIQEGIEYAFAFRVENKIAVLERHAEKRLIMAQGYAEEGNNERVQNVLQNYLQIKERQNNLLGKTNVDVVLGAVEEKTIEQQKIMEEIKTMVDKGTKQEVIQVQERVVNQVAKQVVEANGSEGATEFLNQAAHVWAPGTGPGGEAGVVYEGGGKLIYAPGTGAGGSGGVIIDGGEMKFAPGTSAGGSGGQDIKTVEVKTGGAINEPVPVPDGPNYAPGTTGDSPGNTVESGGIDP